MANEVSQMTVLELRHIGSHFLFDLLNAIRISFGKTSECDLTYFARLRFDFENFKETRFLVPLEHLTNDDATNAKVFQIADNMPQRLPFEIRCPANILHRLFRHCVDFSSLFPNRNGSLASAVAIVDTPSQT